MKIAQGNVCTYTSRVSVHQGTNTQVDLTSHECLCLDYVRLRGSNIPEAHLAIVIFEIPSTEWVQFNHGHRKDRAALQDRYPSYKTLVKYNKEMPTKLFGAQSKVQGHRICASLSLYFCSFKKYIHQT